MADDADLTTERLEREEEARRKYAPLLEKKHHVSCCWCGDPTENGAAYCSTDCQKDEEKYERTLNRVGIRR